MFEIILYQPEIPPNTGNIIRLCANTGCRLHLIEPLGFELDDKQLRRAGLDHFLNVPVERYISLDVCLQKFSDRNVYACTTKGTVSHSTPKYNAGDVFLFGPETRGLPQNVLAKFECGRKICIPMVGDSRSLNLSNSVAIIVYEAWRQVGYDV